MIGKADEFDDILDMLDDYIYKYSIEHKWGYSTAAMMAGVYKSHPNNVIYLTEKFRLDTKDIGRLLSMIDPATRQRYDYDNIQRLYTEYVADKVDDHETIAKLKLIMEGKEILVLVPGNTLNTQKEKIDSYITEKKPIVISVNFVADEPSALAFFGNSKRYSRLENQRLNREVIVSSNVKSDCNRDFVVDYHSLINRGYTYFENSAIMLFNLLKKVNPAKITIAGFDGFDENCKDNYADESYQNERHASEFKLMNKEIQSMFDEIVETKSLSCVYSFLTPSRFDRKSR